jgi:5-methylcytosine-specific restriction protein A
MLRLTTGHRVEGWVLPYRPLGPCHAEGCPNKAVASGLCREHYLQRRWQLDQERPTAAERGYDYDWRKRRERFLRANPECVVCGEPATDVDHILSLAQGGTGDDDNLQALCHVCHSRKSARQDGGFGHKR